MPFVTKTLKVSRLDSKYWALDAPLRYEGKDELFEVPVGFKTDFASVPRAVQALIPSTGAHTEAAVLHDWFCVQLNVYHDDPQLFESLTGKKVPDASGRDTDAIFRRVMRELGVPPMLRYLIWVGVRWGARFNPARSAGWWRDAWKVILISLLVSPIVVPLYIFTTAVIYIDKFFEWVIHDKAILPADGGNDIKQVESIDHGPA